LEGKSRNQKPQDKKDEFSFPSLMSEESHS
jgi:hypothetical protein